MKLITAIAIGVGLPIAGILLIRALKPSKPDAPNLVDGVYTISSSSAALDRSGSSVVLTPGSTAKWEYNNSRLRLSPQGPFVTRDLYLSDFNTDAGSFTLMTNGLIKMGSDTYVGLKQDGTRIVITPSNEQNAARFTYQKRSAAIPPMMSAAIPDVNTRFY